MIKKLLIAVMFFPLVGMGQKDTVWRIGGTPIKIWPSYTDTALAGITFSTGGVDRLIIPVPANDTIKVIMLVCDTIFIPNSTFTIAQFTDDSGIEYEVGKINNRIPYAYWVFGYEVNEWSGGWM